TPRTLIFGILCCVFFFFQAEDGIRDFHVTGVQTCALPIWQQHGKREENGHRRTSRGASGSSSAASAASPEESASTSGAEVSSTRSEERRVGKEWRSRCSREKNKQTRIYSDLV